MGWAEDLVHVSLDGYFQDVPVDFAAMTPVDVQMMGEDARISFVLTVWNEAVYAAIAARFNGAVRGAVTSLVVGSLLGLQGGAFRTLFYAPYAQFNQFATMPVAYNFPLAYLEGPTELELGTRFKKVRCTMRAFPQWNQTNYTYTLYNQSITGRPGPN